jgi:hypothetical protein
MPDQAALKELLTKKVTPAAKREAVAFRNYVSCKPRYMLDDTALFRHAVCGAIDRQGIGRRPVAPPATPFSMAALTGRFL